MFKLPEDLGSLSADELKALPKQIRAEAKRRITAGEVKPADGLADAQADVDKVGAEVAKRALDADDEAEAEAEELAKKKAEEKDEEEDEVVDPGPQETVQNPPATEPESLPDPEEEASDAAGKLRAVPAARGATGTVPAVVSRQRVGLDTFKYTDRAPRNRLGDTPASWTELAENLLAFADQLKGASSDTHYPVASARAQFDERQVLDERPLNNLHLWDDPWRVAEEITAAICGPLPSTYNMACQSATNRPVRASLPVYQTPTRGGFQVMQSPSLEDVVGGRGIWTRSDDANPAATKTCATVKCTSTNSYYIYAIYRCLTVKNLTAMTFPELVEAYLNRLAALQARLAETTLLEAMANETTTVTAHELGYNATTSIATTLLNYLALYREQQRWDDQPFDAWMPRWIVPALQADLMRRRRTDGGTNTVPSEAAVTSIFSDVGVTPHFFRDTPSWATPIPNLQTSGTLGWFPANLEMLVAPRGKFALMDRGDLNIGVAGNVMRDNTSLAKNEFTFFFENFEGVINTTSCPAHVLQIDNLCFNGVQIADIIINCQGGDQRGAAS